MEKLRDFISAHFVKGDPQHIIYGGELDRLNKTIDSSSAEPWSVKTEPFVEWLTITLRLYGELQPIEVPVFSVNERGEKILLDDIKDWTSEYKNVVSEYMKMGIVWDKRGTTLFRILEVFWVWQYWDVVCFYRQDHQEVDVIKDIQKQDWLKLNDLDIHLKVNDINDIDKYENIILLLKEVSDWYYDVRKHSIVDKQQGTLVQQEYVLGRDVYAEVDMKNRKVLKIEQWDTQYWAEKTDDWWIIIQPDGTRINTDTFSPYKTEQDWDILKIWLYWAYTHVLREILKFKPITRQYKFLLWFKRLNFVAWCRRSGKTFLSAYIILRELWRMPNSIRHISRQVRSLYIAPSEDKFKEVIDYIRQSSERVRLLRLVEFNKKENRLSLLDEQTWRNQKTFLTVATCDFSSAKWYEPGRWRAADMVIIDEAAFIPEDVWLNILPIIGNEKAKCFAISTIDWNTNRNWFYEQLVEAEKWLDDVEHIELFGMRVTIDDIDDVLVDPTMKNTMKNSLKHNRPRYYAELYASLPEVGTVFDTDGFYMLNKDFTPGERSWAFIIWYDPAKRTDVWAVVVWHYKIWTDGKQYCQMIEEYELGWRYEDQKTALRNIKQKYQDMYPGCPAIVLIDATQAGDVVAELFGNIIDYRIWFTAHGKRPEVDSYWAWKIPKKHLVHLTQALIENNTLKAWVGLKNLMEEIKNFKMIETPSGGIKYEAEVWHDDHVSAMMLISFYLWYIEGKAYGMWMDWIVITPDGINPNTGLYESTTRRWAINPEEVFPFMSFGFGV